MSFLNPIRSLYKKFADFVLGVIVTSLFALTALTPDATGLLAAANLVLAPLFLGFVPGYALVATMYPAKGDVTPTVRYVLAVLWSFMLAPLLALILYFSPADLEVRDWKLLVCAVTAYLFFVSIIQRVMTPDGERYQPTIWITPEVSIQRRLGTAAYYRKLDRVHLWLLASSAILICSVLYAVFAFDRHDPYTEFYVQLADERVSMVSAAIAEQTPSTVITETASARFYDLWVVNRETELVVYTVAQKTGASEATFVSSFTLAYNERKQVRISLPSGQIDGDMVIFLLFKDDESIPYRQVSFVP